MFTPYQTDIFRLQRELFLSAVEAQSVIAMRMFGMAGFWNVAPSETARMFSEKPEALGRSAMAVGLATITGHSPAQIMRHGLRPIRKKTRANSKRLARRGPRMK